VKDLRLFFPALGKMEDAAISNLRTHAGNIPKGNRGPFVAALLSDDKEKKAHPQF
jgi:hypothetical protein